MGVLSEPRLSSRFRFTAEERFPVLAEELAPSSSESSISMGSDAVLGVEELIGERVDGEGRVRRDDTKCEGNMGILKYSPGNDCAEGAGRGVGCAPGRA